MTLFGVRIGALAALCLLVLLGSWKRRQLGALLRAFWLTPSSPANLAALRIVVFWQLLRHALVTNAVWFAGQPASLRRMPPGWGLFEDVLSFDPEMVGRLQAVLVASALLATLGLFTRVSAPLAALLAVYVFGIPNFYAKINHAGNAPVLAALVIAAAPAGNALSLDRLVRRLRGYAAGPPSVHYTLPVRFTWLVIGTTYLFPGLWKLAVAGDLWLTGTQLKHQMYQQWALLPDFVPLVRLDHYPALLALLGVMVLVFEIGFFFALFQRGARVVAALSAVAFHLGVEWTLGIRFQPFFPLVILLEFRELWLPLFFLLPARLGSFAEAAVDRVSRRVGALPLLQRDAERVSRAPRGLFVSIAVGALILGGQLVAGVVPINSWPISVYPRFDRRIKSPLRMTSALRVAFEPQDGGTPVDLEKTVRRMGRARLVRLMDNLEEGVTASTGRHGRHSLVALFRENGVDLQPGDYVSVYRATWSVLPPGKQTKWRERRVQRYRVNDDDGLTKED